MHRRHLLFSVGSTGRTVFIAFSTEHCTGQFYFHGVGSTGRLFLAEHIQFITSFEFFLRVLLC